MIRSFKKTNTEETRLLIAPLLKSFQNEVDSLSKRSKENNIKVIQTCFILPDPQVASSHKYLGAGGCRCPWELALRAVWAFPDGGVGSDLTLIL